MPPRPKLSFWKFLAGSVNPNKYRRVMVEIRPIEGDPSLRHFDEGVVNGSSVSGLHAKLNTRFTPLHGRVNASDAVAVNAGLGHYCRQSSRSHCWRRL